MPLTSCGISSGYSFVIQNGGKPLMQGADIPVETHYARRDNLHIAYQVTGEGPIDLVFLPGYASHLENQWKEPSQVVFFERLSSFCRLIRLDKCGQGLSDRTDQMPSIDDRMDDLAAVLDAVGCEKISY